MVQAHRLADCLGRKAGHRFKSYTERLSDTTIDLTMHSAEHS